MKRPLHVVTFHLLDKHPVGHYPAVWSKTITDGLHHFRVSTLCGRTSFEHRWFEHGRRTFAVEERHPGTYLRHCARIHSTPEPKEGTNG